jgi:hypothetical protein
MPHKEPVCLAIWVRGTAAGAQSPVLRTMGQGSHRAAPRGQYVGPAGRGGLFQEPGGVRRQAVSQQSSVSQKLLAMFVKRE